MKVDNSVVNRKSLGPALDSSAESLLSENILNNYRSITYNVTMAALSPEDLRDPDRYRQGQTLKFIIVSSKGKPANSISADVEAIVTDVHEGNETIEDKTASRIINDFNKESPGSYDLYIDNIEIESLIAPNKKTGNSIATKVSFNVFEPLSANGFIEALHVSAIAAGWTGYLNACYLLKIEFLGYPSNQNGPVSDAVVIQEATRYIPMKLLKTEMEITENGTAYSVAGVPYNEFGFSNPGQIYTDISFSGATVGRVLRDLINAVNKSTIERNKKEVAQENSQVIDRYEIYFPEMPQNGEKINLDLQSENAISNAMVHQYLSENSIYKFPPIEQSRAAGGRGGPTAEQLAGNDAASIDKLSSRFYDPTENRVHFSKDSRIDEIITAVIRDSHYLDSLLSNIKPQMLDYFQIIIQIDPIGIDSATNVHKFAYKYIVIPYKIHYSQLPDQQFSVYNSADLDQYVRRKYDYLYKGSNIDILSFNLSFNNLFFQASAPKQGENSKSATSDAATASGKTSRKYDAGEVSSSYVDTVETSPISSDNRAASLAGRGRANPFDSYFQIAYAAHEAIIEGVDLLTGEVEIVGDPFYLSTVSMGNFLPSFKDNTLTVTGEAAVITAPVMIRINFKNPIDIDPVTGFVRFSKTLTGFSGVYRVIQCNHIFKDGSFKQALKIIRFRGQMIETNVDKPEANRLVEQPLPGEQPRIDSADPAVPKAGSKPNDLDLYSLVGKGLPSPGLPGNLANIAGTQNLGLKLTAGATELTAGIGLRVGESLSGLDAVASGIRAPASALASLQQSGDISLNASVAQAERIAESVLPNVGSSLRDSLGSNQQVSSGLISSLKNLGSSAAGAIGGVTNKVSNLVSSASKELTPAQRAAVISDATSKGIPVDQALRNASTFGVNLPGLDSTPAAIANQLGIDPAQLSGLSGGFDTTFLKQAEGIAKNLPPNADFGSVKEAGIILSKVSKDTVENLPAIPPKLSAELPELPTRSFSSLLSPEQRSAVITDATSKGIPVDQALRNASTFGVNLNGLSQEAQSILLKSSPDLGKAGLSALGIPTADMLSSKLSSVQNSINSLNPLGSIEAGALDIQKSLGNPGSAISQVQNLGKSAAAQFGSLTQSAGTPLNKLMNSAVNSLGDPGAAPYTGADSIVRARLGLPPIKG